ncbi:ribonuclease Z [Cytophagales bacterium WSM2-2]|nr:ribonuclease Z [Cytophagales bacterium WSM2-2]
MSFSLTILGSSGALPAIGRFPSSQYLTIQNRHFLIDCGEGVQMQMGKFQVSPQKIDHIFISHLHGDHYLGLMPLLFSMHLNKRTNDLHLYSQPGLDEIITLQLKYSKSVLNYRIHFHPFNPSQVRTLFEDEVLTVETIPLIHKLDCAGFLFREKPKPRRVDKDRLVDGLKTQQIASLKTGADILDEKGNLLYRNEDLTLPPRSSLSYAYCSDTAWNEVMIPQITGADLLYHEATFMQEDMDKAIETKHSTTLQAAEIAQRAEVKKLILGHFSARYKDLELVLNEAKTLFENTELAIEGTTFTLHD